MDKINIRLFVNKEISIDERLTVMANKINEIVHYVNIQKQRNRNIPVIIKRNLDDFKKKLKELNITI